ncbi:MAG: helix-turn-helix transcriptional regulator [Oscillatoriophycideae cyanobacterium NC_groundwater_1537_Pr4_S-0.65um_50_18]|nr:helix-turn-helix transcriptional regulator [Oscillatoriophycideae cyanobacterium NC_groundwater_1537_Pr4_S-0.65um_50_18]
MLESNPCFNSPCPIQFVLDLLGNKWSILILRELFRGDRRTHELLAALPGISTKTLTQRLRQLEAQGLVERRIYAEIPPRVEYSLTRKGHELKPVMVALHEVGSQWLEQEPCVCPLNPVEPQEFVPNLMSATATQN